MVGQVGYNEDVFMATGSVYPEFTQLLNIGHFNFTNQLSSVVEGYENYSDGGNTI